MAQASTTSPLDRIPLAIFPSLLGLAGLALAWLAGALLMGGGAWLGWIILIVTAGSYVLLAGLWGAQTIASPGPLRAALDTTPGRQGAAAVFLTVMLLAAGAAPVAPGLAGILVLVALAAHLVLALVVAAKIWRTGTLKAQVSPVWHLLFVGFIVGAQATARLQMTSLTLGIFALSFVAALVIYGLSIEQAREHTMPVEQRPLLMVHIAPVSLFGSTALLIGLTGTGVIFGVLACFLAAGLLLRIRWITAGGFTPFWAAFGFPVAAFASLMLMLGLRFDVFWWIGVLTLAVITVAIPMIFARILGLWQRGALLGAANPPLP